MNQYKEWESFTLKGKKYLALTFKGPVDHVLIIGPDMGNYGTYYDRESFTKMAEREGGAENLLLGAF